MVERFAGLFLNQNKREGPSSYDRALLIGPRSKPSSFFLNRLAPVFLQQVVVTGVSNSVLGLYRRVPTRATDATETACPICLFPLAATTAARFGISNNPRHGHERDVILWSGQLSK